MLIPESCAIQTLRQCTVCAQTLLLEIFRQRASNITLPDNAHLTFTLTLYCFIFAFIIFVCTLNRNDFLRILQRLHPEH